MRKSLWIGLVLLAMAALVVGCGNTTTGSVGGATGGGTNPYGAGGGEFTGGPVESPPPGEGGGGGGEGGITITVGTGTTPTYSWDGGPVMALTVNYTSDPENPVWGIVTPNEDGIESPVTHGTVPDGAIETFSEELELVAGEEYEVSVFRTDETWGYAVFTP